MGSGTFKASSDDVKLKVVIDVSNINTTGKIEMRVINPDLIRVLFSRFSINLSSSDTSQADVNNIKHFWI